MSDHCGLRTFYHSSMLESSMYRKPLQNLDGVATPVSRIDRPTSSGDVAELNIRGKPSKERSLI